MRRLSPWGANLWRKVEILRGRGAVVAVLGGMVALAATLVAADLAGYDVEKLTGDTASTASVHPWTGLLSTLALLGWAASFGACVLAAAALWRRSPRHSRLFRAVAVLLAYLTLDDAYLLHEYLADDVAGVPQPVVYAVLAGAVLLVGWRFRRELAETDTRLLGLAVVTMSASVALDVAESHVQAVGLEEWLKLSGIAAVCGWCFSSAVRALESVEVGPRRSADTLRV